MTEYILTAFCNRNHSRCLESLYIESMWWAERSRWSARRDGGAEINDSREPEFFPAANGHQGGGGIFPPPEGMKIPPGGGKIHLPPGGELLLLYHCFYYHGSSHQQGINPSWDWEDPPPPRCYYFNVYQRLSIKVALQCTILMFTWWHNHQLWLWFDINNNENDACNRSTQWSSQMELILCLECCNLQL